MRAGVRRLTLATTLAVAALVGCKSGGDHILDAVQGEGAVPAPTRSPGDALRDGRTETLTVSGGYDIPAGDHELEVQAFGVIGYTVAGAGGSESGSLSDDRQHYSVTGPGSLSLTIISGAWVKAKLDE